MKLLYKQIKQSILVFAMVCSTVFAQQEAASDLVDKALISIFQAHKGNYVCLNGGTSLQGLRMLLEPYINNIDKTKDDAYKLIGIATYTAFPCPFSPNRSELRAATKADLVGNWVFPNVSLKLRHGPTSPAWRDSPEVPPIKCEGVAFQQAGQYRVVQIRGQFGCPTSNDMLSLQKVPNVQSWTVLPNGRVKIARTDEPAQFEEWDVYVVQSPFEFFSVKFGVGDLVAYLRRSPGNEINATTVFRHLQALN